MSTTFVNEDGSPLALFVMTRDGRPCPIISCDPESGRVVWLGRNEETGHWEHFIKFVTPGTTSAYKEQFRFNWVIAKETKPSTSKIKPNAFAKQMKIVEPKPKKAPWAKHLRRLEAKGIKGLDFSRPKGVKK